MRPTGREHLPLLGGPLGALALPAHEVGRIVPPVDIQLAPHGLSDEWETGKVYLNVEDA